MSVISARRPVLYVIIRFAIIRAPVGRYSLTIDLEGTFYEQSYFEPMVGSP